MPVSLPTLSSPCHYCSCSSIFLATIFAKTNAHTHTHMHADCGTHATHRCWLHNFRNSLSRILFLAFGCDFFARLFHPIQSAHTHIPTCCICRLWGEGGVGSGAAAAPASSSSSSSSSTFSPLFVFSLFMHRSAACACACVAPHARLISSHVELSSHLPLPLPPAPASLCLLSSCGHT